MPGFTESDAREAVRTSLSYAEALRNLGLCTTGGNRQTLRRWIDRWGISTEHFDARAAQRSGLRTTSRPLSEIMVENSTYSRSHLKNRLYREGIKQPRCEICDQGELWRGRRMGLILDHINGVRDDHRLENLRIVCPNCAATLETHCGRKNRLDVADRECLLCGREFRPRYRRQRYCSRECGTRAPSPSRGIANERLRRAERPPYEQLLREIAEMSFSAVGRRYGVSDNAIRKWVRQYEREQAAGAAPATASRASESAVCAAPQPHATSRAP